MNLNLFYGLAIEPSEHQMSLLFKFKIFRFVKIVLPVVVYFDIIAYTS